MTTNLYTIPLLPIDWYILFTAKRLTQSEQAQRTNLSLGYIYHRRSYLINQGLLEPAQKRWSQQDHDNAVSFFEEGLQTFKVARNLKIENPHRVRSRIARHGGGINKIRNGIKAHLSLSAVRNAGQIADLIGIPIKQMYWLLEQGAFVYNRTGYTQPKKRKKPWHYLINDMALMDFLEDRNWWMFYNPAQITEKDWRDFALKARQDRPGRWYTLKEYALLTGYSVSAIRKWYRQGKIDSVKHVKIIYVWVDNPRQDETEDN